MFDLTQEPPISLAEAAKSIPSGRGAKRTHISTVFRWISRGVSGVRLEALRLGGRWVTSREAVQRFAERLTAERSGAQPTLTTRTSARRTAATARAEVELQRIGI